MFVRNTKPVVQCVYIFKLRLVWSFAELSVLPPCSIPGYCVFCPTFKCKPNIGWMCFHKHELFFYTNFEFGDNFAVTLPPYGRLSWSNDGKFWQEFSEIWLKRNSQLDLYLWYLLRLIVIALCDRHQKSRHFISSGRKNKNDDIKNFSL